MNDETNFSTWKDFALHILTKNESTEEELMTLRKEHDELKDSFKEFRTRVYTVVAIVVIIVGVFEISVRL